MILSPFTVAVDTREQLPYQFADIYIKRKEAFVPTTIKTLQTGDYSIVGYENDICVERKTLEDLYYTLIHGRERFENELKRMENYNRAMIVIEADWGQICNPADDDPIFRSEAHPHAIIGTIVAFAGRYPYIKWNAALNRKNAQKETFKFLLNYYNNQNGVEHDKENGRLE
jgi:ERCC4-type nuclease